MRQLPVSNMVLVMGALFLGAADTAHAGVIYPDPAAGWTYTYTGEQATAGPSDDFDSLDGSWDHDNSSDQWDGTAIGVGNPGGVSALTEGATAFLRIQDPGDPRDYGMGDPSNRKEYFGHEIPEATILDDGVTISFRARIATGAPLDDAHPNGGGGIVPWPAGGDGTLIASGGKGNFGVRQSTDDMIVSFSLALPSDHGDLSATNGGLTMNNLNGNNRDTGDVDTGEAGTLNLLEFGDPAQQTQWHEYWITIQDDPDDDGTHVATIYADGSYEPSVFKLTAGNGDDYGSISYLAMGSNMTDHTAAFDVDFFSYMPGVALPPIPRELVWDKEGDGGWREQKTGPPDVTYWWDEEDADADIYPVSYTDAIIGHHVVTVNDDDAVASLVLENDGAHAANPAGLVIAAGKSLTAAAVEVVEGSSLRMQAGAALTAEGGGEIASVKTSGDATIGTGGDLAIESVDAQGAAGTFAKQGGGPLTLASGSNAANTTFKVESGTLRMLGLASFGGGTKMELAGGTFEIVTAPSPGPGDDIGYWSFDNVTGLTVENDGSLGDLLDGAMEGTQIAVVGGGVSGNALQLNTSDPANPDGRVNVGNYNSTPVPGDRGLNFSQEDWTISAWVNSTHPGTGDENKKTIFGNGGDTGGGIRYCLILSEGQEGRVNIIIDDDAGGGPPGSSAYNKRQTTHPARIDDGNWHHVVGQRAGGQLRMYIDGVLHSMDIEADYDLTGIEQHNAYIGCITDNPPPEQPGQVLYKFFRGQIDEVRLYGRALPESEILSLFTEDLDLSTHSVTLTGTATLDVAGGATFGSLAMADGVLSTTATAGGFSFLASSIEADDVTVGIDAQVTTTLTDLNGKAHTNVTFQKRGADLILAGVGAGLDGTTFDVQQGRMIAEYSPNPGSSVGAATLRLNGGNLLLTAVEADPEPDPYIADYTANAVEVLADATIWAGAGPVGENDVPVSVILGTSGSKNVALGDKTTLELASASGPPPYSLQVAGDVSGNGHVLVSEGTVTLSGANTYGGNTQVDAGTLVAASSQALGSTLSGTNLAAGTALAFEGGAAVGAEAVTLDGGGSGGSIVNLSGDNSLAGNIQILAVFAPENTYALLDIGNTGQRVEPGAIGLSGTGNDQNNNIFTGLTSTPETGSDTFDVSITNLNQAGGGVGGLDWRDRGDGSNDPLVALGEDHIKNNNGIVRVTLADLPAGLYQATSYHVDAENTQCEEIKVFVHTGERFEDLGVSGNANFDFGDAGGLTTQEVLDTQAEFFFEADGTNNVVMVFDGTQAADDEVPLSGLLVQTAVVAPSAASIGSNEGTLTLSGAINVNSTTLTFSGPGDVVHTGNIVDVAGSSVVKTGSGTLTLAGDNNYTGGTMVEEGALLVSNTTGSGTGTGGVEVLPGATLGGTGTVGGASVGGVLSPGTSVGTLSVNGELELVEGTYLCEVDSTGADLVTQLHLEQSIVLGETPEDPCTLTLEVLEKLGAPGEYPQTILKIDDPETQQGVIEGDFRNKPAEGDYLAYGVFLKAYDVTPPVDTTRYGLKLFQALEGDTEGDGDVDPSDLSTLVQNWAPAGTGKVWREGNFDDYEDGNVDPSDLSALVQNWAPAGYPLVEGAPPVGSSAAVPEPGTLVLLGMGGLCLWLLWRRR